MTFGFRVLALATAVFLVQPILANALDSRTHEALVEMRSASSDADLLEMSPRFAELQGSLVLWRDAVAIARSELGGEPPGRAAIVRLLRLALLLDSGVSGVPEWASTNEPLDTLTQNDLDALRRATYGFPHTDDAIIYLLNRKPSLRSQLGPGEYTAIRIVLDSTRRVVLERSTAPYKDLGPTWLRSEFDGDTDPVKAPAQERGQTRRFQIKHLPDIVLAAKAFRIAELAPLPRRGFAAYVASEALASGLPALGRQAAEGGETGFSVWAVRQWALDLIAKSPNDVLLTELTQELRIKIPPSAFAAKAFPEAAEAYRNASQAEPERRLWATWGEAISYFAAGEIAKSAAAFERMTPLLPQAQNADSYAYAYIFLTFLQGLPEIERAALGGLATLRAAADRRLGSDKPAPSRLVSLDIDFAKIMVTIGRTDLGLTHIAQRLDTVDAMPEKERDRIETLYLRELGAFSGDLCYDVSWIMSSSAGWKVRSTIGYPPHLDFLHNMKDNGELVAPGEVITLEDGMPYGMLSPEEDCATVFAAYGVIGESTASAGLLPATIAPGQASTASNISKWAISALNRKSPNPSIAPFLKVVWVEWFSQQFASLEETGNSARNFTYRPLNASGIADPKRLEALKSHPAATPQQHALIDLFLSVRALLERRYRYE